MSTTTPYAYQEEGHARLKELGYNGLLADEMGLGKTLQALLCIKRDPTLRPVVIVCPAHLKINWAREAAKHLDMRIDILEGRKVPAKGLVQPNIVILNFDILAAWLPHLIEMKPKLIIADEAHYLQGESTQRTRAMRKLIRETGAKFLAISGTAMTNRPIDLWPILNMLMPKRFKSRLRFGFKYCGARRSPWGWDFRGARNLKALHRKLKKYCMVRRLKRDVLKDLPAKQRFLVPIKLDPKAQKEYDNASADIIGWLKNNYGKGVANRAVRAEALLKIGYLKRLASQLSLDAKTAWVDDFLSNSTEKLIAFGVHRAVVKTLKEKYGKQCAMVHGGVTGEKRQREFDRFNQDKKCRLLSGNVKAAGTGWGATACSNTAFLEFPWAPGDVTQAEDRTHGLCRGQEGVVTMSWWLVAVNTIEEKICNVIKVKQKNVDSVLDGRKVEDMDMLDQLVNKLLEA